MKIHVQVTPLPPPRELPPALPERSPCLCLLCASGGNGTLASLIFRRAVAVRCASTGA